MAEVTMDRVAARINTINQNWIRLNERLTNIAAERDDAELADVARRSERLRGEFANISSLGNPQAWRLLAQGNHFILPDEANPAMLAEHIVRQHIDIPALIDAIQKLAGGGDGQAGEADPNDAGS